MINTSEDLNDSEYTKCSCPNCPTKATRYLNIIHQLESGNYCNSCSLDLVWHGIAEDKTADESSTDDCMS